MRPSWLMKFGVLCLNQLVRSKKLKEKKIHRTSPIETVLLVPTAVGSYNDTRAHTHAHKHTRSSIVRGCHKGKSLKRGCCTVSI